MGRATNATNVGGDLTRIKGKKVNGDRGVAVIIATFRGARTIATAVRSALREPEVREVVVVNDASPDDVEAVARSADDGTGRLKIIALGANGGPARARNVGIEASSAPWITVLDDDDYYEPGRLGRLFDLGAAQWDFVADDLWLTSEDDPAATKTPMWFDGRPAAARLGLAAFVAANISDPRRAQRELGFLKPIMRRSFLEGRNLRYNEKLRLGEDYDLYARALASGARFLLAPTQGYVAVRRPASLSARHGQGELKALRDADTALLEYPTLTPPERAVLCRHRRQIDRKFRWQQLIDAVKARDLAAVADAFSGAPTTSLFLLRNLAHQFALRAGRR